MCPVTAHARRQPGAPLQTISLELLEHIVSELDRWPSIEAIWFSGFGEAMLHPEYRRCLEILNQSEVARRACVIQYTNGSLLDEAQGRAILEIPIIKRLVFSFDGFGDKASYEALRGPNYDRVLRNIRAFAEAARVTRPDLHMVTETILPKPGQVEGVTPPPQEIAIKALTDLFDPMGIEVSTRPLHGYSGNEDLDIHGDQPGLVFGGCQFVENDSLYLAVDGRAQPCCAVFDLEFNIGRVQESDLGVLLNNEPMRTLRRRLRLDQREDLPYCRNCRISLGGELNQQRLNEYWSSRDNMGVIAEPEVRRYVFGAVAPSPHRVNRLDLGSGPNPQSGFVAVDRYPLPGVSVVADFEQGLPFSDSDFDLIYASHSLEHARDLPALMREIYRVAKDRAQIVIVAPYYLTTSNLSNPYHMQAFTEEAPRFWTDSPTAVSEVQEDALARHVIPGWGLSRSDHSNPGLDLRCLRIEYFYFPEYRTLPKEEQRRLRQSQLNVCDQIMYHLLVVKSPLADGEEERFMKTMDYYEPPFVTVRRSLERASEAEAARAADLQQIDSLRAQLRQLELDLSELNEAMSLSADRRAASLQASAQRLVIELRELTDSRLVRWVRRRRLGSDWRDRLSSEFQPLLDDACLLGGGVRGFVLKPSALLSEVPFLAYRVVLDRPGWSGVTIAPLLGVLGGPGELAVEVVSPEGKIVCQTSVPVASLEDGRPLYLTFPPIADSDRGTFELRVAARDVEGEVRVLEWQRPSFGGLRPVERRPLCAFHF